MGPYSPVWFLMVPYRTSWSIWFLLMVLCEPLWSFMILYGIFMFLIVACGPLWSFMVPFGPAVWFHIVTYSPIWSCMFQYGPVWSSLVRNVHMAQYDCMAQFGPVWPWMVPHGMVPFGHLVLIGPVWSSMVLFGPGLSVWSPIALWPPIAPYGS